MKNIKYLSLLLVLIIILTGCGSKEEVKKPEEQKEIGNVTEINTNEGYKKEQKVESLYFSNASLMSVDGNALFEVTVRNESEELVSLRRINITLLDKDSKEIVVLHGILGDSIDARQEKVISSYYNGEIKDVANVKYEIIR